jgi:drug/metabolite transporter (DMT)-like permease
MRRTITLPSDAALWFVLLIWGLNFAVIKIPLEAMHPFVVNGARFGISAFVLGLLYARQARSRGHDFFSPVRTHGWRAAGLGLVGYAVYQVFFIVGINGTTAGSAALITASSPLWTAMLARLAGIDYLNRATWVGLMISLSGTVIVVLAGTGQIDLSEETLPANLLMMGSAICWAVYTVMSRPVLASGVSATALAFFGIMTALPLLWLLAWLHIDQVRWDLVGPVDIAALVFSGALSTGIAYAIWGAAVNRIGPSRTAAAGNIVPLIALASGALMLGERITLAQIAGGLLILGGLYIMRRKRQPLAIPAARG